MDSTSFLRFVLPSAPEAATCIAQITKNEDCKQFHRPLQGTSEEKGSQLLIYALNGSPATSGVFYTPFAYKLNSLGRGDDAALLGCRVLWLDLDVGPDKAYPTKREAIAAVAKFCADADWPKPSALVDSGNGLHVYWRWEHALPHMEWKLLAERFKQHCKSYNLSADHACTADMHRILRLPGTKNKKGRPLRCQTLRVNRTYLDIDDLQYRLKDITPPNFLGITRDQLNPILLDSDENHLITDVHTDEKGDMDTIIASCQAVAEIAESGGADCAEPLWRDMLGLAAHVHDGEEWAHKLSEGHAGYSHGRTEAKYYARSKYGPPLCETIRDNGGNCDGCPHKVKTPLTLGRKKAEPDKRHGNMHLRPSKREWLPLADGLYRVIKQKDDEVQVKVAPQQLLDVQLYERRHRGTGTDDAESFLVLEHAHGRVGIPTECLHDNRQLATVLNRGMFNVSNDHLQRFGVYLVAWIQQLRSNGKVIPSSTTFGWLDEAQHGEGFVVGSDTYHADGGKTLSAVQDKQAIKKYSATGSPEPWQKAVRFLEQDNQPAVMSMLATSFAAPLMRFTAMAGAAINFFSPESGVGKTSAMRVAQAVWGDPAGIFALQDTPNSINKQLGVLNNLPCYWDEIRMEKNLEGYVELMFSLSQGREKARLNKDAKAREVSTWQTLLISATNDSLLPYVNEHSKSSDAAIMRLLEIQIPQNPNARSHSDAERLFRPPRANYGHAGREYAQYLAQNADKVSDLYDKMRDEFTKEIYGLQGQRFWVGTISAMLTGAAIAKHLGLVNFDLPGLKAFLISVFHDMNKKAIQHQKMTEADVLVSRFLHENADRVLITDQVPVARQASVITVKNEPSTHRGAIVAQYATDPRILRIYEAPFRDFLAEEKVTMDMWRRKVAKTDHKLNSSMKVVLGHGTDYHTPTRIRCFQLTLKDDSWLQDDDFY